MVEGDDLVEEHEAGVGDAELVFGEGGELFDLADDVVGEEADGPGGEGRQAGEAGRGVAAEGTTSARRRCRLRRCGACGPLRP